MSRPVLFLKRPTALTKTSLLSKSIDMNTMLCTFGLGHVPFLGYEMNCNKDHPQYADVPACFEFHPSAWFRPASATAKAALNGLALAARPDHHPPVGARCLFPDEPPLPSKLVLKDGDEAQEGMSSVTVEGKVLNGGWTVCTWPPLPFLLQDRASSDLLPYVWSSLY